MVKSAPERAAAAAAQARAAAGDYNAHVAANRIFRPPDFVRGKLGEAVMGRIFSPRGSTLLLISPLLAFAALGFSTFAPNHSITEDERSEQRVYAYYDREQGIWTQPTLWNRSIQQGTEMRLVPRKALDTTDWRNHTGGFFTGRMSPKERLRGRRGGGEIAKLGASKVDGKGGGGEGGEGAGLAAGDTVGVEAEESNAMRNYEERMLRASERRRQRKMERIRERKRKRNERATEVAKAARARAAELKTGRDIVSRGGARRAEEE